MCEQESRRSTCVHEDEDGSVRPPAGGFDRFVMRVRRKSKNVPFFLLVMVLTSFFHAGSSVWSFNIPHQVYIVGVQPTVCRNLGGLSKAQINMCMNITLRDHMTSIGVGAKLAIDECRFQFQYRRWNCSIPEYDKGSLFERITAKDTREAAFTYAISSAGVVWALARACAEGNLSSCSCSRERRPAKLKRDYQWGGCGDDLEYGIEFGTSFMNAGEEHNPATEKFRKLARTLMNLHNNEVGRLVVKDMSIIECKCHGVSGSCSLKTCWRQLSEFRDIGNTLHDKYDAAMRVELRRKQGRALLLPKGNRRASRRQAPPTKNDLVYMKNSPNFCYRDPAEETLGTRGRKCIKDAPGTEGCKLLCCEKGYNTRIERQQGRCKCKFYWCCKVKCKVCSKNVTTYTCK